SRYRDIPRVLDDGHPETRSMRIPWDEIKARIDLATLATSLLGPPPRRSGRRLLWHCPFHEDRRPGFQVDPQPQRWECYPCSKGGDAAALLMQLEGIGFAEAVGRLAIRTGWVARASPSPPPPRAPTPAPGLAEDDARALVDEACRRLLADEGR